MATYWSDERKLKHSNFIKELKPWLKSTGAKTVEGKAKSKMNACKGIGREANYALNLITGCGILNRNEVTHELLNAKLMEIKLKQLIKVKKNEIS